MYASSWDTNTSSSELASRTSSGSRTCSPIHPAMTLQICVRTNAGDASGPSSNLGPAISHQPVQISRPGKSSLRVMDSLRTERPSWCATMAWPTSCASVAVRGCSNADHPCRARRRFIWALKIAKIPRCFPGINVETGEGSGLEVGGGHARPPPYVPATILRKPRSLSSATLRISS